MSHCLSCQTVELDAVRQQEENTVTTIKAFIKRHPVLIYLALTFAISWGSLFFVIGPGGILGTKEQSEALNPFLYLAMLLGPSLSSILLAGLIYGRVGLRELLSRLLKWRIGIQWYAVALLTALLLRQGYPSVVWYCGRADGGHFRGARLDRLRHPPAKKAL
jgi:hypothetical protein